MKVRKLLLVFVLIGILTSAMDIVFLRIAFPVILGENSGERNYSARLAYDYLRDHISAEDITQNNPMVVLDRPSGMYGTHQMVISDRTGYGVPSDAFDKLKNEVGVLFTDEHAADWQFVDRLCREHSIDVLIINDTDPVWDSLPILQTQRTALYENAHYALFPCGDYAHNTN